MQVHLLRKRRILHSARMRCKYDQKPSIPCSNVKKWLVLLEFDESECKTMYYNIKFGRL